MSTSTAVDVDIHPHFQFVKLYFMLPDYFNFNTDGRKISSSCSIFEWDGVTGADFYLWGPRDNQSVGPRNCVIVQ